MFFVKCPSFLIKGVDEWPSLAPFLGSFTLLVRRAGVFPLPEFESE